ncbi:MAG: hypothetical protein IIA27_09920 [Gemmatimonadetes bacterium]|nr:hypothetical protein [Gemmatimonadota bacterium]
MRHAGRIVASAVVVALLACDGDPKPPTGPQPVTGPGFVRVQFTTPNTDDGAVYFTVRGASIDSLISVYTLQSADSGPDEKQVITAGAIRTGGIVIFWVPDRSALAGYTAVLQQVATRGSYELRDLEGYSVAIIP